MDLCLRTGGRGSALIRRDECVCLESASKGASRPQPLPSLLPRTASASSPPDQAGPDSRPRSPLYLIRTEVPSAREKDLISIFPLQRWDTPVPPQQGPFTARRSAMGIYKSVCYPCAHLLGKCVYLCICDCMSIFVHICICACVSEPRQLG